MTDRETLQIGLDLGHISVPVLELILAEEPTGSPFFREVLEANRGRVEILELLREHPATPDDVRAEASGALSLPVPSETAIALKRQEAEEAAEEEKKQSLLKTIQKLSVGEKIHLAMRGGREVRNILLKDTSKEVLRTVMSNPKLTESEVELIAMNRQIPEEILRTVAKNREWMKNYAIVHGLVTNPKTPAGIAANLVVRIRKQDLVKLERNKNVPELVRASAKRILNKSRSG